MHVERFFLAVEEETILNGSEMKKMYFIASKYSELELLLHNYIVTCPGLEFHMTFHRHFV